MIKYLFTVSALLLLAQVAQASPTARCTARCAYRTGTTCTAPAYVHVDCIGDGKTETTDSDASVRPFHDLQYKIDYGDSQCRSGQGTWPNSDIGASKNQDFSPIGAHVYECPGTFAITTTVTDSRGATSTTTDTVTVQAEDAGWPGTATKCVANTLPTAGVGGCPAGAQVQQSNDFDAAMLKTAGTRTLYKCGDTFVVDADPAREDATANGSLIGGYSATTCIGNPVLITHSGTGSVLQTGAASQNMGGWRFRDLRFTLTGAGSGTQVLTAQYKNASNFLTLRIERFGTGSCWTNALDTLVDGYSMLSAEVSGRCDQTVHTSGSGTASCANAIADWNMEYGLGVKYGAMIDTYRSIAPTVTSSCGGMRFEGPSHFFIAHSKYKSEGNSGSSFQFRDAYASSGKAGVFNVVQDWTTLDDGTENYTYFRVCPESGCNDSTNQNTAGGDFIFDSVRVVVGSHKTATPGQMFLIASPRVTIRNSIWNRLAGPGDSGLSLSIFASMNKEGRSWTLNPDDSNVYNNTVIRGGATSQTGVMCSASSGVRHRCKNNLFYDDKGSNNTNPNYTCSGCSASNNLHLRGTVEGCPFFGRSGTCNFSTPGITQPLGEFKLRTDGLGGVNAVRDTGFTYPDSTAISKAYVFQDAFGGCRGALAGSVSGPFDVGAAEIGSANCLGVSQPAALAAPQLLAPQ
jgi:hypothetical protein